MKTTDQIFFIILAGMALAFLFRFAGCTETVEIERNKYYEKIRQERVQPKQESIK